MHNSSTNHGTSTFVAATGRVQRLIHYYGPSAGEKKVHLGQNVNSEAQSVSSLDKLMLFMGMITPRPQLGNEIGKAEMVMVTDRGADGLGGGRPDPVVTWDQTNTRALLLTGKLDNLELFKMYSQSLGDDREEEREDEQEEEAKESRGGRGTSAASGRFIRHKFLVESPRQEDPASGSSVQQPGGRGQKVRRRKLQGVFLDAGNIYINDTALFIERRSVALLPSLFDRDHFFSGVWSIVAEEEEGGSVSLYYIENKLMYDISRKNKIVFESSPIVATYNIRQAMLKQVLGGSSVAAPPALKTGQWMLTQPVGAAAPDINTSPVLNTAGMADFRRMAAMGKGSNTMLLVPVWGSSTVAIINATDGSRSILTAGLNSSLSVSLPRGSTGDQKVFVTDLLPQPRVVAVPFAPSAAANDSTLALVGEIPKNMSGPVFPILGAYSTSANGEHLFIADVANNQILRMDVSAGGTTTVIAGSGLRGLKDGTPAEAQFDGPWDVAVTSDGCNLFVTDGNNIRYIALASPAGDALSVKTVAQILPGDPVLGGALGLALALNDSVLYVGRSDGQIHEIAINQQALYDCVTYRNNSIGSLPTAPQTIDEGTETSPILVRTVPLPSTQSSIPAPLPSASAVEQSSSSSSEPTTPPPPPADSSVDSSLSEPTSPPPPSSVKTTSASSMKTAVASSVSVSPSEASESQSAAAKAEEQN